MATAHERRISVRHPLRVGTDYRWALRRAHDHYHRGALSDAAELVARTSDVIPNHDADSAAQALFLYANIAARRTGIFPDDCATTPYLAADPASAAGVDELHQPQYPQPSSMDLSEVAELYDDVATLVEEELDADPSRLSTVSLNKGIALLQGKQYDDAEAMFNGALALLRKCFTGNHIIAADAHHNLGVVAEAKGDAEMAKAHYVESLMIRSKFDDSLRLVDQALVETMTNLALVSWRFDGDAHECVRQLLRLVPLARRLPKRATSDLALAAVLCHLGAALAFVGSAERAQGYLSQSHTLRTSRLGADHPLTVAAAQLLAACQQAVAAQRGGA